MTNQNQKKSYKGYWLVLLLLTATIFLVRSIDNFFESTEPTETSELPADVPLPQFEPTGSEINCVMETNYGTIEFMLFPEQAPNAVENFVTLAEEGYYDGLTFHRVIEDFMIQGGDPSGNGTGGEACDTVDEDGNGKFDDEISDQMYHFRGAICYANSGADTNGSQFYIVQAGPETLEAQGFTAETLAAEYDLPMNVAEKYMEVGGTPHLDGGYTVFGMVTSGMEVVDEIAAVETNRNDVPVEPVIIESITVVE